MHLPHLAPFERQPLVFLTCCTKTRRAVLAGEQVHVVLKELWSRSAELDGWFVGRYLLMPDHVHLFACPALSAKPLSDWVRMWKSVSSRRLCASLEILPPLWQRDYFDHFVRNPAAYDEKWRYVEENPVRKGLCGRAEEWSHRGEIHQLNAR